MPEKPSISVIVPIYNTENYLEQCLRSIMEQSFRDIEILCVDDCSTDGSAALVERLASEDARIRLLRHTKNTGAGGARNSGIRAAKGDYIASVDSDDYIDPHMLETMWRATLDQSVDVVVCGISKVDAQGGVLQQWIFSPQCIDNSKSDFNIFSWSQPVFWNKLWRTSLCTDHGIEFPHYKNAQDTATIPRLLYFAKRIHCISDILYYYRLRDGSSVRSFSSELIEDELDVYALLYAFIKEHDLYARYGDDFLRKFEEALIFRGSQLAELSYDDTSKIRYLRHLLLIKYGLSTVASEYAAFMDKDIPALLTALRRHTVGQNAKIRKRLSYRVFFMLFSPFMSPRHRERLARDPFSYFRKATHSVPRLFRPFILEKADRRDASARPAATVVTQGNVEAIS